MRKIQLCVMTGFLRCGQGHQANSRVGSQPLPLRLTFLGLEIEGRWLSIVTALFFSTLLTLPSDLIRNRNRRLLENRNKSSNTLVFCTINQAEHVKHISTIKIIVFRAAQGSFSHHSVSTTGKGNAFELLKVINTYKVIQWRIRRYLRSSVAKFVHVLSKCRDRDIESCIFLYLWTVPDSYVLCEESTVITYLKLLFYFSNFENL